MNLRFLGKESKPNDSPTLYATDRNSYIVQGYIVTDPAIVARFDLASDETLVEVPARLMIHLEKDGITGGIERLAPPIIHIKTDGNYIMRGPRVIDAETLSQMSIPNHETAIEISKSSVLTLLAGV